MLRIRSVCICLLVAILAGTVAPEARAVSKSRWARQVASGVCEPFVPNGLVRYNASGLRGGSSLLYVVCSMSGAPVNAPEGQAIRFGLVVTNESASNRKIPCTACPGVKAGGLDEQLASPQETTLVPGESWNFLWATPGEFNDAMGNANFTCALPPGTTLNFIDVLYVEDVGA